MRHPIFGALLIGVTALILTNRAHAQPVRPFVPGAWWKDYQKPLGLSADQVGRIDMIFQDSRPHLRHQREQLDAAEAELSRLIQIGTDDASLLKQSERVESLLASLNRDRTMMLVHMRAILTPEQRNILSAIRDQWDRDHPTPQAR
jgi:Spy/CpxP family protein refolding chaperone